MKKVGFVIGLVVVLVGVILFYPESDNQKILVEDNQLNQNASLSFYIEGEDGSYSKSNTLPSTGYTLNSSKSVCSNGAIPAWEDNRLYFNNLTKNGTSCYLYFDIKPTAGKSILANTPVQTGTPDFSKTAQASCSDTSTCEETNGLYAEKTSKGTTYYFRGAVDNNWVKFAGFYWRIIQINEDGSLRLIYSGDESVQTTGIGTQITVDGSNISAFNSSYRDNMYAGYMYTSAQAHGYGTDSTIKGVLDDWYYDNLRSYADDIDRNAGFCNDRTPYSESGTGASSTKYAAYNRLRINKAPTFECSDSRDLFTTSGSSQGNKALQYPIGLITADEVVYAGGVIGSSNSSYYLYTNSYYWTMSPSHFSTSRGAYVFCVFSDGNLSNHWVDNSHGVRPVINLKADITLAGSGTSTDPYVVEGAE